MSTTPPRNREGNPKELRGCGNGLGAGGGQEQGSGVTGPLWNRGETEAVSLRGRSIIKRATPVPGRQCWEEAESAGTRRGRVPPREVEEAETGSLTSNAAWGSSSIRASEKLRKNLPGEKQRQAH